MACAGVLSAHSAALRRRACESGSGSLDALGGGSSALGGGSAALGGGSVALGGGSSTLGSGFVALGGGSAALGFDILGSIGFLNFSVFIS
jgi:hypothetical protein